MIGLITPMAAVANGNYVQQVVELVNQERWDNGQLPPLKSNPLLGHAATSHSTSMAVRNFFAHCDVDTKTSPWDRLRAAGYGFRAAGENIAAGQRDPADVMNAWMNSSGHRRNILSTNFREIGVGYVFQSADQRNIRGDSDSDCNADSFGKGPYYRYWTQDFGSAGSYPLVIEREADEAASVDVDLYVYGQGFATEMRFRNEDGAWSAWESYAADKVWRLSAGAGSKQVNMQIRNSSSVLTASDEILSIAGCSVLHQDHYLQLSAQTVRVSQAFTACNTLTAGSGGFRIAAGEVTFHAPRIVLRPGFSVAANAALSVMSAVP
jgi:hypothetical protein